MRKLLLLLTFIMIGVTTLQLWATRDRTDQNKEIGESSQGEARIGGEFTLTDQTGKTVHDSDFRGDIMLVYFGFTHCPDICPVTANTLTRVMESLGDKANQVTPVFITVDPERDTPEVMKDFLSNFDKRMIGLTGTPEQIKAVAAAYKTYYAKTAPSEAEAQGHDESASHDEYSVDHSGFIYMMGKDGKYVRLFPYDTNEQEIVHAVEHYLQ